MITNILTAPRARGYSLPENDELNESGNCWATFVRHCREAFCHGRTLRSADDEKIDAERRREIENVVAVSSLTGVNGLNADVSVRLLDMS